MTIAVDINEVLRDYLRAFKKQYNKVVNPDFEIEYDDINDFDLIYSHLQTKKVIQIYQPLIRLDLRIVRLRSIHVLT